MKTEQRKPSALLLTRIRREDEAAKHDEAMLAKYGYSSDGYANWHNELYQFEYPLPYSFRYFYHFVDLFFSNNSDSSLLLNLNHEFVGDATDADYIEELLTRGEKYGLFTNGFTTCFYDCDGSVMTMVWSPEKQVDPEYSFTNNTYYGGKTNRERRKRIRNWLKIRAEELAQDALNQKSIIEAAAPVTAALSLMELRFESICVGNKALAREQEADRIRAMWEDAKKMAVSKDEYPAIATAVYKVARFLGMVEKEVQASKWQPIVEAECHVVITEGIGKYSIERPPNKLFRSAVERVYAYCKSNYPNKTRSAPLPSNY